MVWKDCLAVLFHRLSAFVHRFFIALMVYAHQLPHQPSGCLRRRFCCLCDDTVRIVCLIIALADADNCKYTYHRQLIVHNESTDSPVSFILS